MNIQTAHKIANEKILKVLEGCGKEYESDDGCRICKETDYWDEDTSQIIWATVLCTECKAKLKGILIAQEKEVEFLKTTINPNHCGCDRCPSCKAMQDQRLEALKISNKELEKIK